MSVKEDNEFRRVFHDEMTEWIVPRRKREKPPEEPRIDGDKYLPKVNNRLVGLALSGGGIRSATYALVFRSGKETDLLPGARTS